MMLAQAVQEKTIMIEDGNLTKRIESARPSDPRRTYLMTGKQERGRRVITSLQTSPIPAFKIVLIMREGAVPVGAADIIAPHTSGA